MGSSPIRLRPLRELRARVLCERDGARPWRELDEASREHFRHRAATERYRSTVQFQGQPQALVESTRDADSAVRHTRDAFAAGAFTASVVRTTDGEVIYDGPLGIGHR